MRPECMVCRKAFGKGRIWKEAKGSICRRCKRDLESFVKQTTRHKASGKRLRFRFGLFDNTDDSARAEEIWNKPIPELTSAERDWLHGVMNFILRTRSARGRKADAEHERIERLLVRLALAGKPRPSYGQIAELLLRGNIDKRYKRDQVLKAMKRRRTAKLQSPPLN
jgi:hypothetical protein